MGPDSVEPGPLIQTHFRLASPETVEPKPVWNAADHLEGAEPTQPGPRVPSPVGPSRLPASSRKAMCPDGHTSRRSPRPAAAGKR